MFSKKPTKFKNFYTTIFSCISKFLKPDFYFYFFLNNSRFENMPLKLLALFPPEEKTSVSQRKILF